MPHKFSRYAFHLLIATFLLASLAAKPRARQEISSDKQSSNTLIVHEWGTFTSVAGKDGVAVEWRPLEDVSDLPRFVYAAGLAGGNGLRHGEQRSTKLDYEALVRMETPVIYFYADRATTVSVRVDFTGGKITEWYPQARGVFVPAMQDRVHASVLDWGRITIMPGAEERFPVEAEPSHYYQARETDASPVRVCGAKGDQTEKFLFYRGVGTFQLPLAARVEGAKVAVRNISNERLGPIVLFENHDGRIGYQVVESLEGETILDRPRSAGTMAALERDLESMLVARGLFKKEARAMIKTWRDSWFEEGLRIFYFVPRKVTDRILPLSLEPAPAKLERVMVGRVEIIPPEIEDEIRRRITSPGSESDTASIAAEIKHAHGRFAEPMLKAVLENTAEPELRARIQEVIGATRH